MGSPPQLTGSSGDTYQRLLAEASDPILARATLVSTDGEEIRFEVCLDDSGEPSEVFSPYHLAEGRGFDTSEFAQIE